MRTGKSVQAHGVFWNMIRKGLIERDVESNDYRLTDAGRKVADLATSRDLEWRP